MRVEHELPRGALVEVAVSAWRIFQWQYCDIDRLRDIHFVMQDGHHQLAIVAEHGTLPGSEAMGLGPAQAASQAQHALPRVCLLGARIVCDVQTRNSDRTAGAS